VPRQQIQLNELNEQFSGHSNQQQHRCKREVLHQVNWAIQHRRVSAAVTKQSLAHLSLQSELISQTSQQYRGYLGRLSSSGVLHIHSERFMS
jgi:Ni,Fe-hydrogenase III component G